MPEVFWAVLNLPVLTLFVAQSATILKKKRYRTLLAILCSEEFGCSLSLFL